MNAGRLVYVYVLAVGALLLLEGGALLIVDRLALSIGFSAGDTRHNLLHVAWGAGLLAIVLTARDSDRVAWTAVIFGLFYASLAVMGVLSDQPFGLALGPGENIFHFTVGPLALVLGGWALRSSSASKALTSAAARGDGSGSPAR